MSVTALRPAAAARLKSPSGQRSAAAVVLVLVGIAIWASGNGSSSGSGDGGGGGRLGSGAATAVGRQAGDPWASAPDMSLSMQLPSWAGCPLPPCHYTEMIDGPPNNATGVEPEPWRSQFGEDQWLFQNLFFEKRNGFFLEFGAMNGKDASNTHWLAKATGWKGMLIEACPHMYAELAASHRTDAICVHAAVCATFRNVHWLSSVNVGGIVEFMSDAHKKEFHPDLKLEEVPMLPCVPLQFILDKMGIADIDLWSLDVEGAELEVLKTVDFSRLRVKVIMVELPGHEPEKELEVHALLNTAGFHGLNKTQENEMNRFNTVFVHEEAWPHLRWAPNITAPSQ